MAQVRFADGTAGRLRQCLDDAGFTLDALTERLGEHAFAHVVNGELAPLRRATRAADRLDVLLRLFVLGVPVPSALARPALGALSAEQYGGVIDDDRTEARSLLALRPAPGPEGWLVAHDLHRSISAPLAEDHVLGLSASTMALAGATIRRPIGAAFDLGTGCGIQALHASVHSDRVVASDLNRRAVALARFTMALNGIGNVDVREGDRFGPVASERFDLIVGNPPFVISPSRRYLFRDNALAVDELCRTIVRAAATHLTEGGHAQFLASWAHVGGTEWRARLASWFEATGCDALVLERERLAPSAHAASWLRQTEPADRWQPEYDDWMAYYERHHIEAIGFGLITMRKRAVGAPWTRVEEAPEDWAMPCGDHLGAVFELTDLLAAGGHDGLLDLRLRIAPDVVLDERARATAGGWSVTDRILRQTAGLRREGRVDEAIAAVAAACDGLRPLRAILGEVAAATGEDPAAVAQAAIPVVRRLVERAFLLPSLD